MAFSFIVPETRSTPIPRPLSVHGTLGKGTTSVVPPGSEMIVGFSP